ncbi:MAG: phosphoenolpyruvate carboxykinase (ATP), partial [Gemmatimonadota bacterium]
MATRTDDARDLEAHGLQPTGPVHWNLAPAELIEHAVCLGEGALGDKGAFVVRTVPHTGRSPNDKFIVREPTTEGHIGWG